MDFEVQITVKTTSPSEDINLNPFSSINPSNIKMKPEFLSNEVRPSTGFLFNQLQNSKQPPQQKKKKKRYKPKVKSTSETYRDILSYLNFNPQFLFMEEEEEPLEDHFYMSSSHSELDFF